MGIERRSVCMVQIVSCENKLRQRQHQHCEKAQIELEFGNYLNEKHFVESNQDPLEWWRVNRTVYPKLALSAQKWLSVCATSTASERVFSSCGVALSAKRSNLNGSTLKAQILLKNNLPCSELHLDDIVNAL